MVVSSSDRDHAAYVLYDSWPRHVALRVVPEPAVGAAAPAIGDAVEGRDEVVLLAAGDGSTPCLRQSLDRPRRLVVKQALVHLTRLREEEIRFFAGSDSADPGRGWQEQPSYRRRLVDLPAVVKAVYACIDVAGDDNRVIATGDQDVPATRSRA